jgi:hypothetical protein
MDCTYIQLHIYDCPPGQQEAARDAIVAVFGGGDDGGRLLMDEDYTCEDAGYPYSALEDLAQELATVAPGASFSMWDEPGDGAGVLRAYTPERGHFSAPCDHGGTVVLGRDAILAAVRKAAAVPGAPTVAELEQAVADATGAPWHVG